MTTTHDDMPLPEPDTHCIGIDTGRECWLYSEDLLRARDAQWQARLEAAVLAEREACAAVCEAFIDAKEQARARLAAAEAMKHGTVRAQIDRLSHESTVNLYNRTLDKCAAAIRARGQT